MKTLGRIKFSIIVEFLIEEWIYYMCMRNKGNNFNYEENSLKNNNISKNYNQNIFDKKSSY